MMLFTLGGFFKSIISLFKTRVLSDGGTFEAETNLENQLNTLGSTLFDSASLVITPNGVKTSKLYSIKPSDGTGDLTVVRNTSATRIDENSNIVNVPANVVRIDYSNGSPAILVEPQRTNLVFPSDIATTQVRAVKAVANTLSFYGTGTVTLSGAFSGSLIGTGTNNRVSLTFTPTAGNLTLTVSGSVSNWQLEAGSNATSLIKTVSGSVTRNADYLYNNTTAIDLIGQTEGTIFLDFDRTLIFAGIKTLLILFSAVNDETFHIQTSNNEYITIAVSIVSVANGVSVIRSMTLLEGRNKLAVVYSTSGTKIFLNGTQLTPLTNTALPVMNLINLSNRTSGRIYGPIRQFSLWKTQITDQQAIQLTTL